MLNATDLKINFSSLEFSLYNDHQNMSFCPSCGHYLVTKQSNEVRMTSILVLVGVGSFICYKLYRRRYGRKRIRSFAITMFETIFGESYSTESSPAHEVTHYQQPSMPKYSSTPQLTSFTTMPDIAEIDAYSEYIDQQSLDLNSPTLAYIAENRVFNGPLFGQSSLFGKGTIAKLDQLLNQIEDIKGSVAEMDADLSNVGCSVSKTDQLLELTGGDLPISESHSPPSLEWDSNDINLFKCDLPARNTELVTNNRMKRILRRFDREWSFSACSPITTLPSPSCSVHTRPSSSSGNGSFLSSPDLEHVKLKRVDIIVDEAQRLGITSDLIEKLLKGSKRDSAYCED